MPQSTSFRVFVSAVTNELASYRDEVVRVLRRKELDVRDQEHFRQGGATLIEKLREYVAACDAVVLLIGDQCGGFATEQHAAMNLSDDEIAEQLRPVLELSESSSQGSSP